MRAYQIVAAVVATALVGPASAATVTISATDTGTGAGAFTLSLPQPPAVDPDRGPVLGVTWEFTLSATIDGTVRNFFSQGNNTLTSLIVGVDAINLSGAPATLTAPLVEAEGESHITPLTLAANQTATFSDVQAVYRESGTVSEGDLLSWVDGADTLLGGDITFFSTIRNDGGAFAVTDQTYDWTVRLDATYAYIPLPASSVLLGTAMALILGVGMYRRRRA